MPGDPARDDADDQDLAEVFDETNITRDGEDIAHPDMARDVYDVTSAQGDGLEGENGEAEETDDFDPDQADEAELELMLESDEGVDAPRNFVGEDGLLVAAEGERPSDYEPETISDEALEELGYEVDEEPAGEGPAESRLDEGLEETFPASDPVSISPGAD